MSFKRRHALSFIESRILNQLQFKNCHELKAAFLEAEVSEKVWKLEK